MLPGFRRMVEYGMRKLVVDPNASVQLEAILPNSPGLAGVSVAGIGVCRVNALRHKRKPCGHIRRCQLTFS